MLPPSLWFRGFQVGKKDNLKGIVNRAQLLNICASLKIERAFMMSNKEIVLRVAKERPIKIGPSPKANVETVIQWFHKHENDAIKSARRARTPKPAKAAPVVVKEAFYKSWEWRTLRMKALKEHGARCQCCGAGRDDVAMSGDPVKICVDHIKPLATHWHLRLDPTNLQVLCDECNQGKGAWDDTDWRGRDLIEAQLRYVI